MELSAIAFWTSLAALLYVYGGFPLLVLLVGSLRRRHVRKKPVTPSVSLIIAAYNEEEGIARRLDNALAQDYPPDKLEIIIASDGSHDATDSIVGTYVPHGVRLLSLPRRGKIHALTDAVAYSTGEILVFSDANSICNRQALRKLAANFADPGVGGVAANTSYTLDAGSESSSRGEDLYWRYDTRLKELETLSGSIVSAHGGLYAIRRQLFPRLHESAVTDDFAISTAVVEQGFRLVFEKEACACEVAVPKAEREFSRRVRLMTRGLRGLLLRRRLLNPFRYGFYSLVLFSHKALRRLLPLCLILLFATSLYLAPDHQGYLAAAAGQALFYTIAAFGFLLRRFSIGHSKLFYIPFYYCMANAAALLAVFNLIAGQRIERWEPQRHTEPQQPSARLAASAKRSHH